MPKTAHESADFRRDKRRRRAILRCLHGARKNAPLKAMHASRVLEVIDDSIAHGDRLEGDADAFMALVQDLIDRGYVEQKDMRVRDSQPYTLGDILLRVTGQGTALIEEAIAPDPLVDDDRRQPSEWEGK